MGEVPPCCTRPEGGEEAADEDVGDEGGIYHQPRGNFVVDPSPGGPLENFVGGVVVVDQMAVEEGPHEGVDALQENDQNDADHRGQGGQKMAVLGVPAYSGEGPDVLENVVERESVLVPEPCEADGELEIFDLEGAHPGKIQGVPD